MPLGQPIVTSASSASSAVHFFTAGFAESAEN